MVRNGLWTFFNKNAETRVGECKICNKRISYKITTSNLKQHLKLIHRELYNNFFPRPSSLENVSVTNSDEENSISDNDSDTTKILITSNSDIWDVFEAIENTKTALCFVCNKVISFKSTIANLKQHLKLKHIEVYNLIVNKSSSSHDDDVAQNSSEDEEQKIEYLETYNNANSKPPSPAQNVSIENSFEVEDLQQDVALKPSVGSRRHPSQVWNFFEADHDTKIGQCNLCQKKISFKSTIANLKQHLKLKHIKAYNILVAKQKSLASESLIETDQSDGENSQKIKQIEYNNFSPKRSPSSSKHISVVEFNLLKENSLDCNADSSKPSRKLRSDIWHYFKGNHITQVAQCNLCQKRFSFKSTSSNLKQHLRLKHYKAYTDLILKRSISSSQNIFKKHSSDDENSPKDEDLNSSKILTSDLWDYFKRTHVAHVARCSLCQKKISFKSTTSNLKQHLRLKHYKVYNRLITAGSLTITKNIFAGDSSEGENSPQDLNVSKSTKRLRSDLWNYFEKNHLTDLAKCNLCQKLISFKSTTSNLAQHLRIKHHDAFMDFTLRRSSRLLDNVSGYSSDGENSLLKTQQLDVYNEIVSKRSTSPLQNDSVAENSNENWQQDCKNNIWMFFKSDNSTKRAKCNLCQKIISYKGITANLETHLKANHLKIYSDFISGSMSPSQNFHAIYISAGEEEHTQDSLNHIDDKSDSVSVRSSNTSRRNSSSQKDPFEGGDNALVEPPTKIQKISSKNVLKQNMPEEKNIYDRLLLKTITDDFQPLSIVEDGGFQQFVAALNPNYRLPSRKNLSTLLTNEYAKRLPKYQNMVQHCLSISLSLDCWTSRNMQSYMAVTGHFVDQNSFKLCSVLIECTALNGQHTADKITSELRQTAKTWGIMDKVNLIVSDNALNMVSAARILNWPHFGCYARKFNLIVQGALNDVSITSIVTKVQKTVAYFKRNCVAKQMLCEYQVSTQKFEQPKSLLLSVPTRWISVYQMLKRFSEIQDALRAVFPNIEDEIPVITLEEWQCIDQIVEVLKPFEEATTIMSTEGYIIASKAVVLTSGLYTVCTELADSKFCEPVANLVLKLKNGLTTSFGDIEKNKEVSMCTLLDPRFKQHAFEDEAAMVNAKQSILDKFQEINKFNDSSFNETAGSTTTSSTEQLSTLWERFDTKVASSHQPEITEQKTVDELNMYISENAIPRSECPLRWWKERKIMYPVLSKIFIACFNTVVTSLPCDKAFSKTGHILSDRRTRLTTSKVDKIMFLHVNK